MANGQMETVLDEVDVRSETDIQPGYKMTEEGLIPIDWKVQHLAGAITLLSGQHILAQDYSDKEIGIPYLTGPSDFTDGSTNVTKWTTRARVVADFGDILLTVKGSGAGGVNRLNITRAAISRQLMAIRSQAISQAFLYYALQKKNRELSGKATGNLIPGLSRNDVMASLVALPSVPEQNEIAAALCDIDALITSLDKLIAKKRDLKQGAMQDLLTGRRRIPGFNDEWRQQSLDGLIDLLSGQHILADDYSSTEEGVPYLTGPSDFQHGLAMVTKWTTRPRVMARSGDILLTVKGSGAGGVAYLDIPRAAISRQLMAIRGTRINQRFLFYSLQLLTDSLAVRAVGNLIPGLGRRDVLSLVLCLPSITEQMDIATILSDMDAEIAALGRKRDKTRALKQGMMQELLTGRTRLV
jgi:type I restriction enzyme, S subunit